VFGYFPVEAVDGMEIVSQTTPAHDAKKFGRLIFALGMVEW
jgi:hypothetical protein